MDRSDIYTHFYLTARDKQEEQENSFQPKVNSGETKEKISTGVILISSSGILLSLLVLAISLGNGF